ncbi:hypothetical protein, partial [Vannielia litorea]|uniref:hypothetical protein n=1 Tax=Vannielia litorea TaxID=1217970 RepID=UPI001BCC4BE4
MQAHLASAGASHFAGQEARLIDLPIDGLATGAFRTFHDEADARAFAKKLLAAANGSHGTAGTAFVEALLRRTPDRDTLEKLLEGIALSYAKHLDIVDDPVMARSLDRFAFTALAGELATRYDITGWTRGDATSALLECARLWLGGVDGGSRREAEVSLERTRQHLAANGACFAPLGDMPAADGWVDDDCFYIRQETWKSIHGESDGVSAAKDCPSSGDLEHERLISNGGSGSLWFQSMPLSGSAASAAPRWSWL